MLSFVYLFNLFRFLNLNPHFEEISFKTRPTDTQRKQRHHTHDQHDKKTHNPENICLSKQEPSKILQLADYNVFK